MITTLTQPVQMAACAYAGLLMGILRDGLTLLFPTERMWLNALKDVLFWAGCAIIAAVTLFLANGLVVRFFALIGFLAGFLVWRFAATPFLSWVSRLVFAGARRFFGGISTLLE